MAKQKSRSGKRTLSSTKTRKKEPRLKAARTSTPRRTIKSLANPTTLGPRSTIVASSVPQAIGAADRAKTVIYIHGVANKPPASVLKCQWDTALFGTALGDRSRLAYWVNRDRYPAPSNETCGAPDSVVAKSDFGLRPSIAAFGSAAAGPGTGSIDEEIQALTPDPDQQAFLASIATKIAAKQARKNGAEVRGPSALDVSAKIIPLPERMRRFIAEQLTKVFLADVYDFLFDKTQRDLMEQSLIDRLEPGGGPFVVIAHSQGTMIAYDVLRRLDPKKFDVALFVTIGSPLGLEEVQDAFRQWTGGNLPFPPCVRSWINVADPIDPVALDPQLANDYDRKGDGTRIVDQPSWNLDSPRDPHSATGYLATKAVKNAVNEAVGASFQQPIAPFALAKDLVANLEDGFREERHEVLIQLSQHGAGKPLVVRDTAKIAAAVGAKINEIIVGRGEDPNLAEVERLRHFIAAKLNRVELESLRSHFTDLKIDGIWRNARKAALISASTNTVQARPANVGYGADGRNIVWAVLDTGIRADHPHFQKHANVLAQWDCTKRGNPQHLTGAQSATLDGNGHGTHVAAIIAGELEVASSTAPVILAGMAPRCSLYGFKVLDDQGSGRDSWIVKALDKIAELNEVAGQLVVHGVNLSLGGNFDPSVFGCGHTPLCQELRRLWQQGVLVCLAAGNEGFAILSSGGSEVQANMDLSIGDPANLDEAIAVGSVHKTNPHTYGISYFSSRGPTADGRRKPDVVAPGEKILSARYDFPASAKAISVESHYIEMSGTSMAAPHVSGLLAAFLSLRTEFVGYPDRVKKMLLEGCVDLGRDPYAQGAGLPNLIKMLALN